MARAPSLYSIWSIRFLTQSSSRRLCKLLSLSGARGEATHDTDTAYRKWGLCAEACSSVTFQRIMGRQKAASLILAGDRLTAQELDSAGLISKILPNENFMERVLEIARRVAAQPSGAVRFNKRLLMEPIRVELLAANERECQGLKERGRTAEPREAIAAFRLEQDEKRKAKL